MNLYHLACDCSQISIYFLSLELSRGFFYLEEVCDFVAYFVAYFAEYAHALFFCAPGIGGVFKGPMSRVFGSWEDRTIFFGVVANGDDEVKVSIEILIDAIGCVVGYVDADFTHGANGQWVDCCGADACAMGVVSAIAQMAK